MAGFTSLLLFLLAGFAASLCMKTRGLAQITATTIVLSAAFILLGGYTTSEFDLLNDPVAWLGCSAIAFLVSAVAMKLCGVEMLDQIRTISRDVKTLSSDFITCHRHKNFMVRLCGVFVAAFVYVQLAQITSCFTPTSHYDSLSYIMPRMAQYVQQGNLDFFESNFIAQTVHFKNATILQAYLFVATGYNECMVQFVSLISSWLAAISVFGIARFIWKNKTAAIFSAAIFSMFINNLMIGVTPQLDMPITGFIGASVFFLCNYFSEKRFVWLSLACLAAAISFGVKASALLLAPSLIVIACVGFWHVYRAEGRRKAGLGFSFASVSAIVFVCLFMLPAGYLENYDRYEDFMGPEGWRKEHVLKDVTSAERLTVGTTNAARYLIHFVSFLGLPSEFESVQSNMRKPLCLLFNAVGIDVLSTEHTRQPFPIDAFPRITPDESYWGPAALLFVFPAVILGAIRYRRHPFVIAFTLAGLAYFVCQSYSSRYDPWRGRSFVNLGVFMAPLIGCLFLGKIGQLRCRSKWFSQTVFIAATFLVVFAAVSEVHRRAKHISRSAERATDRVEMISRSCPAYIHRFQKYESLVPPGSTVLLSRRTSSEQQYMVYGEKLNRRIVFTEAAAEGKTIDFKIIASKFETPLPDDIPLDLVDSPGFDGRWYLRPLRKNRLAAGENIHSGTVTR